MERSHRSITDRRVEVITKEKYIEVPVLEYKEVIVEIPKIEIVEKIVEVPQVEIVEVPVEYIIEVPQIEIVEIIKEVPIDQHVEVPVEVEKEIIVKNDVSRFKPKIYETVQPYEFRIPTVDSQYEVKNVEFFVPRFIQVPIPSYLLTNEQKDEMKSLVDMVDRIANHPSPSLGDVEQVTEWLVRRQKDVKDIQDNPQPTKDYFDKMAQRLPTGTFSNSSSTALPRMVSSTTSPFTVPQGSTSRMKSSRKRTSIKSKNM